MENGHEKSNSSEARHARLYKAPLALWVLALVLAIAGGLLDVLLLPNGYTLASLLAPITAYLGALFGYTFKRKSLSASRSQIITNTAVMAICSGFLGFLMGAPQALTDLMQLVL